MFYEVYLSRSKHDLYTKYPALEQCVRKIIRLQPSADGSYKLHIILFVPSVLFPTIDSVIIVGNMVHRLCF